MVALPLPIVMLESCQARIRRQVCPHCFRRGGAACERSCPIFAELPTLLQAARRLDPMASDRARAIRYEIGQRIQGKCGEWRVSPLARHRRRLTRVIQASLPS